jgi:nucleoside-diphosphate-sugar epimerase
MTFETAIVTGASGFIGRNLCEHLQRKGKRVLAIARAGSSNVPHAHWVGRMEKPDVEMLDRILNGARIDAVFHCAAHGVSPLNRNIHASLDGNVIATAEWVEAAATLGAQVFVYTGSCSEYGSAEPGIPIQERAPLEASDIYGASKAAGGLWGKAVASQRNLNFQWMRLFGVYGPGEGAERLLPYLLQKLRAGQRVDLTPGQQIRDFLFIDDVVAGLETAANISASGTFNLCSGLPTTVREFAESVFAALEKDAHGALEFGARPYRPDEPLWMVGCPDSFTQRTGFRPAVTLAEGISRSIGAMQPSS